MKAGGIVTSQEKKKPGPKPKPDSRRGLLQIRVAPSERGRLEKAAGKAGEFLSSYIRKRALSAANQELSEDPPENTG